MATDPLGALARWRAAEGAIESGLPLAVVGGLWVWLQGALAAPAPGRPWTALELSLVLGAAAALTGWAMGRQLVIFGRKKPWTALGTGAAAAIVALVTVRLTVSGSFESWCGATLQGQIVDLVGVVQNPDLGGRVGAGQACQVGGVPGNPYLPGTLVLPAWSGALGLAQWAWLALAGALGALGSRDRRLVRTAVLEKFSQQFRLAPAAGLASAMGDAPKDRRIFACANPTLWGELCGQIYGQPPEPGAWCVRCQQTWQPCERALRFTVVTLFSGDVDVLNGLERLDTVAWRVGEPMPPDARLSGQERWVSLGELVLPDVITVAQALAITHEWLNDLAGSRPEARAAAALAKERMSRICAWIWFGRFTHRLTYARPTARAVFAIGPARLRDLVAEGSEELVLQLDIGLLPLEIRAAFRRTFLDEGRAAEVQNTRTDLWIPVAPAQPSEPGVWVDRVEGEALRAWLATERRHSPGARGVSEPLPYSADGPAPSGTPARLDLVRMPLRADGVEPDPRRSAGDSIAEWDWLSWEQIALLRQQVLVQVAAEERS